MLVASFFVVTVRVETGSLVVYDDDPADSGLERVGKGAANAASPSRLAATLAVLALYKFRCTRILRGYMMLSSGLLLGLLGACWSSRPSRSSASKFADLASFGLCAYNGAVLGVLAIYEPAYLRFPKAATQAALVVVAVVMAWQLSHYPPVTSRLMGETGEPLPGLLYEADLDGDGDGAGAGAGAPSSVKLGLGDFVFCVLVSNASSHAASGAAASSRRSWASA
ncbi:hypothetical protein JL721_11259 [Aureococcus anophagefferens]|nr:hypothetical protein JL721_11259 [Aureococcus anophagefferens]